MNRGGIRTTRAHEISMASDPPTAVDAPRARLLAGLPVTERRLQVAGLATAVLEGGDGPSVVLLHGPGEYGLKWLRVMPDLVRTHRVIAPDMPGHGSSDPLVAGQEMESVLNWLHALIDLTCPRRPALVGQILGGAIAARFATQLSDRLSRLVLVDSMGLAAFQPAPDFGRALNAFLSQPSETTHDQLMSFCAFDWEALREQLGTQGPWLRAYKLDRASMPALRSTQHALMEQFAMKEIPRAALRRIAVPTTLIWGRHDLATPLSVAESASAELKWPLHVIEKAADDPPMEQPEAFLDALRTALGNYE